MSGFRVSCVHCGDQPAYVECDECGHQTNGVWPFDGECPNCGKPDGGYGCLSCEKWTRFDEMPDYQAKVPPPFDDYEAPPDPDIEEPPPFDDYEVPPDLDVAEPSDGFQVTCVHCNDCYDNGNCVVCPHCYYTASDSYWPFDCRCPDCGKRLDGHNCASCLEFTPFNQMPDYLAQVSPSVEVTEPSEDVETSTVEIKRLPFMKVILIIFTFVAAIWYFLDKESGPRQNSAGQVQKQSADSQFSARGEASANHSKARLAKQAFLNLPTQPELSASIAEQADYIVESSAYWCGQLAQAMEQNSVAGVRALTEDLPVYLSAHRSTLDLCHAKILASEATIAERLQGSPEVQRKRMAAIGSVKRELEAVETYLAKCDILWDEVSASLSGSQSSSSDERTRDWVSQLHNLMEGAATMLQ